MPLPEKWHEETLRRFPEFEERFELNECGNPYSVWQEIWPACERAYARGDRAFVARVLGYADWCINQPQGETAADDLATCVMVCFVEEALQHDQARLDVIGYIDPASFMNDPKYWVTWIGEENYQKTLACLPK
jgi:hypothetical protein